MKSLSNEERKEELVVIGTIGRARDVSGEFIVNPLTDVEDRFTGLKSIFLVSRAGSEKRKVLSVRYVNGTPIMRLEGIRSKEEVAKYANKELAVLKEDIAQLPEDQFYQFDLIGCTAFEGEKEIGRITNVEQYPANDVIYIESSDGTTYSLAAIDAFVKKIDIPNKRIEIDSKGLVNNKV